MDKPYLTYDDERLKELYQEERDKLSSLPDADTDFVALDNAIKRRFEEMEKRRNENE
jgi:hypothetical protein